MKKIMCIIALAAATVCGVVGCATTDQGRISADIVYKVYEKIAEKEGSDIETLVDFLA